MKINVTRLSGLKRVLLALSVTVILPVRGADTPAGESPVDRSAAQHPFLYAGEWDTRKPQEQSIFIVREGKIVWQYSMPIRPPAAESGVRRRHLAFQWQRRSSRGCRAREWSARRRNCLWEYPAPPGTEIHSVQSIGKDRVLIMRNGNPAKAMIINTVTNSRKGNSDSHDGHRHARSIPAHSH